jgi:uncharacterized RDD family membrane protein YckC
VTDDRRLTDAPDLPPREEGISEEPAVPEPERETDREVGWGPLPRDIRNPTSGLASRGARLGAALLDMVFVFAFVLPPVILADVFMVQRNPEQAQLFVILMVVAVAGLLITQAVLLSVRGQSLGKLVVGIRIARVEDGRNPGFARVILARNVLVTLIGNIPCVGPIFSLVNILYIFGADRRCLHDYMANTIVVVGHVPPEPPSRPDDLAFRRDAPL